MVKRAHKRDSPIIRPIRQPIRAPILRYRDRLPTRVTKSPNDWRPGNIQGQEQGESPMSYVVPAHARAVLVSLALILAPAAFVVLILLLVLDAVAQTVMR